MSLLDLGGVLFFVSLTGCTAFAVSAWINERLDERDRRRHRSAHVDQLAARRARGADGLGTATGPLGPGGGRNSGSSAARTRRPVA